MKITVEESHSLEELEIVIRCNQVDDRVVRLMGLLSFSDARLTGIKDRELHILNAESVLYIDTADRATFLYTIDGVYETPLRLYELEEQLAHREFIRVSKSAIVNFDHVRALRPDFGGRLRLTMSTGEIVIANRQYVPIIKTKLGLGKE